MTTQKIIEGNKLIAEFMNVETAIGIKDNLYRLDEFSYWEPIPYQSEFDRKNYFYASELKYHSSWDWLMPVVEKINNLADFDYSVTIYTMDCYIEDKFGKYISKCELKHSTDELIKSVWCAIVDFIIWYNKNK